MRCTLLTGCLGVAAGLFGPPAQAQEPPSAGDPLKARACVEARATLEAARAAVTSARPSAGEAARIEQARRAAARTCLGEAALAPRPAGRMPRAPLAVTPLPAPHPAPVPPLAPPSPPIGSPPPVLTACDAHGCWDSHGRRLERAGPLLLTPQGPCTSTGGLLNCP